MVMRNCTHKTKAEFRLQSDDGSIRLTTKGEIADATLDYRYEEALIIMEESVYRLLITQICRLLLLEIEKQDSYFLVRRRE